MPAADARAERVMSGAPRRICRGVSAPRAVHIGDTLSSAGRARLDRSESEGRLWLVTSCGTVA